MVDVSVQTIAIPKRRIGVIEAVLWVALATLTVILPNAFKEIAVLLLTLTAMRYALLPRRFLSRRMLLMWGAVAIVTLFYILVGLMNGAPPEAGNQAIIIYIISPLLWIIALRGALMTFGLARLVRFLVFLTFFAMLSQLFYYWAIFNGRFPALLVLMAGSPNIDYSDNQIAAVMFVFGSMIFLYSGLFASPEVVRNKGLRMLLMLGAFVSALTSGRSALVLGLLIGTALFVIFSFHSRKSVPRSLVVNVLALTIASFIGSYALWDLYGIDVTASVDSLWEKISSGGGAGRQSYLPLLLEGAADHFFLGAGHGIGVSFTVSEQFPWRYEVVGAAALFRVGLVGFLVYAAPFILAMNEAYKKYRKNDLNIYERYLLGTLIAGMFSANTNPYIEAVVFQWMFILPATYFIDRKFMGSSVARMNISSRALS